MVNFGLQKYQKWVKTVCVSLSTQNSTFRFWVFEPKNVPPDSLLGQYATYYDDLWWILAFKNIRSGSKQSASVLWRSQILWFWAKKCAPRQFVGIVYNIVWWPMVTFALQKYQKWVKTVRVTLTLFGLGVGGWWHINPIRAGGGWGGREQWHVNPIRAVGEAVTRWTYVLGLGEGSNMLTLLGLGEGAVT